MKTKILIGLLGIFGCFLTTNSASSQPATTITVSDALGRQVVFETLPQRIVITGKAFFMIAEAVYLFPGAEQRVIATGKASQNVTGFMKVLDPNLAAKALLESNAGAEQIAAFHPDAVLLKSYLAEPIGKTIEALDIPVVYLDLETPEQYTRDLRTLGVLLGQPTRAEELVRYYQQGVERIQTAIHDVPEPQKPKVLLLQYSDKDGVVAFQVPPVGWMQTRLVELAGGVPVWRGSNLGQGWATVTLEQIVAWDADVIVIISYFKPPADVLQAINADLTWKTIRTVQAGKLYAFPGDFYIWDQPNPRWKLGLTWLARKLHPDRFADVDMRAVAQAFFQELYQINAERFETQIQPMLKGDIM